MAGLKKLLGSARASGPRTFFFFLFLFIKRKIYIYSYSKTGRRNFYSKARIGATYRAEKAAKKCFPTRKHELFWLPDTGQKQVGRFVSAIMGIAGNGRRSDPAEKQRKTCKHLQKL
jgi:hypothetical protein